MNDSLNYIVPLLKFTAIFIAALSGSLGLLVDFKKEGKITKWGRFILITILVSFVTSTIMEGIEMYRSKEAARSEQLKTQNLLKEISRGVYGFSANDISFDVDISVDAKTLFYKSYVSRLKGAFRKYSTNPKAMLPNGVEKLYTVDINGHEVFDGFLCSSNSSLYPNKVTEKEVYDLIGNIALDVKIYKFDEGSKMLASTPALNFRTINAMPSLEWRINWDEIELDVNSIKVDLQDFSWRNNGTIQSLTDLSNARIEFSYSDSNMNNFTENGMEAVKNIDIHSISFNVLNRMFSCMKPCTSSAEYPISSFNIPENALKTHLNIRCK